jgi:hypothetical protein
MQKSVKPIGGEIMKTNATYMKHITARRNAALSICLSVVLLLISGCATTEAAQRGALPYYSLSSPLFDTTRVGTLEEEYEECVGAVVVTLDGPPLIYEDNRLLEPGSAEESLFIKSGASSPNTGSYYVFKARITESVDNRSMDGLEDAISLKKVFDLSVNDPLYQYYRKNPAQKYLLLLFQGEADKSSNTYWYSIRAAYYVKDGIVFSTNNEASIDSYSGRTVRDMSEILHGYRL